MCCYNYPNGFFKHIKIWMGQDRKMEMINVGEWASLKVYTFNIYIDFLEIFNKMLYT